MGKLEINLPPQAKENIRRNIRLILPIVLISLLGALATRFFKVFLPVAIFTLVLGAGIFLLLAKRTGELQKVREIGGTAYLFVTVVRSVFATFMTYLFFIALSYGFRLEKMKTLLE